MGSLRVWGVPSVGGSLESRRKRDMIGKMVAS